MADKEMSLTLFFQHCNSQHRECFSALISRWDDVGLPRSWCSETSVALQTRFAGEGVDLFLLCAGVGAGKSNSIEVEVDTVQRISDQEQAGRFLRSIKDIHSLEWEALFGKLNIIDPGDRSGVVQQKLSDLLLAFALR